MSDKHPSVEVEGILTYFRYDHLPLALQGVCSPFYDLAHKIADGEQNHDTTACLRKLLEAKFLAVRANMVDLT